MIAEVLSTRDCLRASQIGGFNEAQRRTAYPRLLIEEAEVKKSYRARP